MLRCPTFNGTSVRIVFYDTVHLSGQGDEATAVRFTITNDGDITNVNSLPKELIRPS